MIVEGLDDVRDVEDNTGNHDNEKDDDHGDFPFQ